MGGGLMHANGLTCYEREEVRFDINFIRAHIDSRAKNARTHIQIVGDWLCDDAVSVHVEYVSGQKAIVACVDGRGVLHQARVIVGSAEDVIKPIGVDKQRIRVQIIATQVTGAVIPTGGLPYRIDDAPLHQRVSERWGSGANNVD